jgi:hypothetical protein
MAVLLLAGCSGGRQDCTVANSSSGPVGVSRADEIRALSVPSVSHTESLRLTYDAFVADAAIHWTPRPNASARMLLSSYSTFIQTRPPEDQLDEIEQQARKFGVSRGTCFDR